MPLKGRDTNCPLPLEKHVVCKQVNTMKILREV